MSLAKSLHDALRLAENRQFLQLVKEANVKQKKPVKSIGANGIVAPLPNQKDPQQLRLLTEEDMHVLVPVVITSLEGSIGITAQQKQQQTKRKTSSGTLNSGDQLVSLLRGLSLLLPNTGIYCAPFPKLFDILLDNLAKMATTSSLAAQEPVSDDIMRLSISCLGHLSYKVGSKISSQQMYRKCFDVVLKLLSSSLASMAPISGNQVNNETLRISWKCFNSGLKTMNIILGETKHALDERNIPILVRVLSDLFKVPSPILLANTGLTGMTYSEDSDFSDIDSIHMGAGQFNRTVIEPLLVNQFNLLVTVSMQPKLLVAYLDVFFLNDTSSILAFIQSSFSFKIRLQALSTIKQLFKNCKQYLAMASLTSARKGAAFISHSEKLGLLIFETHQSINFILSKCLKQGESDKIAKECIEAVGTIAGVSPYDRLLSDSEMHETFDSILINIESFMKKYPIIAMKSLAVIYSQMKTPVKQSSFNEVYVFANSSDKPDVREAALYLFSSIKHFTDEQFQDLNELLEKLFDHQHISDSMSNGESSQLATCKLLETMAHIKSPVVPSSITAETQSAAESVIDIEWWIKFIHVYAYFFMVNSKFSRVRQAATHLYSLIPESCSSNTRFRQGRGNSSTAIFCVSLLCSVNDEHSADGLLLGDYFLERAEACKALGTLILHHTFQQIISLSIDVETQVFNYLYESCKLSVEECTGSQKFSREIDELRVKSTWALANFGDINKNAPLGDRIFKFAVSNLFAFEKVQVNVLRILYKYLETNATQSAFENEVVEYVLKCINSSVPKTQWNSCRVIKTLPNERLLKVLFQKLLVSKNTKVRMSALQTLADVIESVPEQHLQLMKTQFGISRDMNVQTSAQVAAYKEIVDLVSGKISSLNE